MRHSAAVAVISLVVFACAPVGAEPRPADPRASLDPLAKSLVDGEYCSGLVVALIPPDAPPQIFAWGETTRGNGKAPDGNTVFELGSVSKVFTSLLLAELVIDKQVLDQRAQRK